MTRTGTAALLLALCGYAGTCTAHVLSAQECREGGDFIYDAALSRDNGVTRAFFIGRMRADFVAIRAFPKELRWFAQDREDEALLLAAAKQVFDAPQSGAAHRQAFLAECMAHTASLAP
ncbi:MAG: hypothetical protein M0015_16145 [Betaproteobacteria bacterium]|nr:hypothetical protein [Betaproteobacteria bacterium]